MHTKAQKYKLVPGRPENYGWTSVNLEDALAWATCIVICQDSDKMIGGRATYDSVFAFCQE